MTVLLLSKFVFWIVIFNLIHAKSYSVTDDFGYFLETRERVINDVYLYIKQERKTLSILKRYLDLFKVEYKMASQDVSKYVENPLNAFVLINRLMTDLKHVKNVIKSESELGINITKKHENLKYPTSKDLRSAGNGLRNLRKIYLSDIKDIANGKLIGSTYSTAMTASDCYEFGRVLFHEVDPEPAISMMEEALRKYYEEKFPYLFTDTDIMEFISYGHRMLGDLKTALYWVKKILNIDPKHERSIKSLLKLQKKIDNLNKKQKK